MAKEFFSRRGVPFQEFDVGDDQEAAMRMVQLSGQQGVPVITIDDQVIVGFDRRRLEQLLTQPATGQRPRFGAQVADARPHAHMDGAYIGRVGHGSPADAVGLKQEDVIIECQGQPVRTASDLQRIVAGLQSGERVAVRYVRSGQHMQAVLTL